MLKNETLCKERKLWKKKSKIFCVPEKEKCVSTFRISKEEIKCMLKMVVDERKNSVSRIWT